jgi:hypothetical protein
VGWLDSLITGVAQLGGSLGGAAIKGSFEKQAANIGVQGSTSQGYIVGATGIGTSGWQTLGQGYNPSLVLASQLGQGSQGKVAVETARIEAESKKNQTLLFVALGAVALVVVAIIFLKR